MKKIVRNIIILLMVGTMLASCSTERRALSQMRNLTYEVEARGEYYTQEQWQDAYEEYKRIDDKMDVKKLKPEQQKEYGELQARCLKQFAKCKVESVVDRVKAYVRQASGFLHELLDFFK